jgi:hypothetical protein
VRSYTAACWRELFEGSGLTVGCLEAGGTELPGGLAVMRWCRIGNTPPAAEKQIIEKLAAATKEQLSGLGIRTEPGEFYIPGRTLIITGLKA